MNGFYWTYDVFYKTFEKTIFFLLNERLKEKRTKWVVHERWTNEIKKVEHAHLYTGGEITRCSSWTLWWDSFSKRVVQWTVEEQECNDRNVRSGKQGCRFQLQASYRTIPHQCQVSLFKDILGKWRYVRKCFYYKKQRISLKWIERIMF